MLLNRLALLGLGAFSIAACRQAQEEIVVVTEIVQMEGQAEPVVVTRVIPINPEVVATVASGVNLANGEAAVVLDLSSQEGQFPNLDPQQGTTDEALNLIENLFVGLTRQNHQTDEFEPALAERWEVSADGKIWTFFLRDDLYWVRPLEESGEIERVRRVVADDLVFAIRRACDARTGTPYVFILYIIEGCEVVNRAPNPEEVDLGLVQVVALDAQTVEIRLTRRANHFLAMSSLWVMRPLPAEIITEFEEDWVLPENLLVSGPFVISSNSVTDKQMILVRNPFWSLPFRGNVDVVNIFYVDEETAFELWEDKGLDVAPVPASELGSVLDQFPPRYKLIPSQEVFYLAFNFESPVFNSVEMRRAFGAAIDRQLLIEDVFGSNGISMRHLVPPGVFGALPVEQVGTGYSPDFARVQMAQSPFQDCRFIVEPITYLVSSSDVELQQAELLQQMWEDELSCPKELFVIEQVPFGTLLARTRADVSNRPDMWHLGWASYYPDAQNWFGNVLHCTENENRQKRACGEVDRLIEQAWGTVVPAEQLELYRQVERLFFADDGIVPIVPLYARARYVVSQDWLTRFVPAIFGGEQYDTYQLDAVQKELERTP